MENPIIADGILFDLDGTLVNSLPDIVASVHHTLTHLGYATLPEETIREYVGDGISVLIERCLEALGASQDKTLKDKALALYVAHHDRHCLDGVTLYEGVPDVLSFFSKKKKAVISNKAERFTKKILEGLGILPHFDVVLGGDSLSSRKPDPMPAQFVLSQWALRPDRAVLVGDGWQDVQCGRSAGLATIAVTYGFAKTPPAADRTIRHISELKTLIR